MRPYSVRTIDYALYIGPFRGRAIVRADGGRSVPLTLILSCALFALTLTLTLSLPILYHLVARQDNVYLENRFPVARDYADAPFPGLRPGLQT